MKPLQGPRCSEEAEVIINGAAASDEDVNDVLLQLLKN